MSIYVVTKRDVILTVAKRFDNQYTEKSMYYYEDDRRDSMRLISKQLNYLDLNTCSAKAISEIIGNDSWTELKCQECKKDVEKVIHIGDDEEFYGPVVLLCENCLKKVNKIFDGHV